MPKSIIRPFKMIDAGDMSADVLSEVVNVEYMDSIGIQAVYSGSPVGDLKVQVSNDYGELGASANWSTLASLTANLSGSGESSFAMSNLPFAWLRMWYDRTSGTGSLTARITAKRIGG